jgi:hypothetical protein
VRVHVWSIARGISESLLQMNARVRLRQAILFADEWIASPRRCACEIKPGIQRTHRASIYSTRYASERRGPIENTWENR